MGTGFLLESSQVRTVGVAVNTECDRTFSDSMTVKSLQSRNYCHAGSSAAESFQSYRHCRELAAFPGGS